MKPRNLLILFSDEHSRDALGCYGHPLVQTPHLDALAARGVRFNNAYTPCPICVPARASLSTGKYVHEIGNWDNAFPYHGAPDSWGHRLNEQGFVTAAIGKLHFRSSEDDNGFTNEIDTMQVVGGIGDPVGCLRDRVAPRTMNRDQIYAAGAGCSTYLQYDMMNAEAASKWLVEHANDEKPWVLFVGFVCPHPPYVAPERWFEKYKSADIPLPPQCRPEDRPRHPAIQQMLRTFACDWYDEDAYRKAIAAYLGVCSYLDEQIGEVLNALEDTGLSAGTRVIYTSDHGDSAGARGLFGKFTMYEESAAVPMILAGPEVPAGRIIDTPVSLVDMFPTVLECVGAEPGAADKKLPGRSLWQLAESRNEDRAVFSEYHAIGAKDAVYMLRDLKYKYVYYVNAPSQLFDLECDPQELKDLAESPSHVETVRDFERRLRGMLDPEIVDSHAKADQKRLIDSFGGEEAVLRRGTFNNSPVPGEKPKFVNKKTD